MNPRRGVPAVIPGALARLSALRFGARRCQEMRYAPFLRRTVRCAQQPGHRGEHAYRSFDEVVSWAGGIGSERPLAGGRAPS